MADATFHRTASADGAIRYDVMPASVAGPYVGLAVIMVLCGVIVSCSAATLPRSYSGASTTFILLGIAIGLVGCGLAVWRMLGRSPTAIVIRPDGALAVGGALYRAAEMEGLEVATPSGVVVHGVGGSAVYIGTGPVGLGVAVAASAMHGAVNAVISTGSAVQQAIDSRSVRVVLRLRGTHGQRQIASGLTIHVANRLIDEVADDLGWLEPRSTAQAASAGHQDGGQIAPASGDGMHPPALSTTIQTRARSEVRSAVRAIWRLRWVRWASTLAGAVLLVWGGAKGVEAVREQRLEAELSRERAALRTMFDEAARRAGLTAQDAFDTRAALWGWGEQFTLLPTAKRQAFAREVLAVFAPDFDAIRTGTGSDRMALALCNVVLRIDLSGVDLTRYGVRFPSWGVDPITYGKREPIRNFDEIDKALAAEIGRAPHASLLRACAHRLGHPVPP